MPDDGVRIFRDQVIGAFDGPGIDPPSLDGQGDTYGWVSQDRESLPKRITPAAVLVRRARPAAVALPGLASLGLGNGCCEGPTCGTIATSP